MVRINLTNNYFIEQEPLNYTLKQSFQGEKKDGTPKESVRTIGYFGNLEGAVKRYLKLNCLDEMDGLSVDMQKYVDLIAESNNNACAEILKRISWGIEYGRNQSK